MKRSILLLIPLLLAAVGCSQDDTASDSSTVAAAPTEDSAEATVRYITDGLGKGQPVVVWNALPESYQADVNGLVQTFGQNMDPQTWTTLTTMVRDVHKLLVEKREFIVNHPAVAASDDPEAAAETVDHIAGLLQSVLDGAGDLEKLKTFDGAEFLDNTGADIVQQANAIAKLGAAINPAAPAAPELSDLEKVTVETVTSTEDSATLKITSPDGTENVEKFTKVEGKWLPAEMVAEWDESIAEAKAGLAELQDQEKQAQMRMGVMMVSGMASGMLASLQNASTQEEFNQALEGLQQSAAGMLPGMGGMGSPTGPPPGFGAPPSFGDPAPGEGTQPAPETAPESESAPESEAAPETDSVDEVKADSEADAEAAPEGESNQSQEASDSEKQ